MLAQETVLPQRRRMATSSLLSIDMNLIWYGVLYASFTPCCPWHSQSLRPETSSATQNQEKSSVVLQESKCIRTVHSMHTAVSQVFDNGCSSRYQDAAANSNIETHKATHQKKPSIESLICSDR
jgi:hypothetical protein